MTKAGRLGSACAWLLAALLLVLTPAARGAGAAPRPQLAVFFPTTTPPKDLEKALAADPALAGFDVVVHAKFREFEATMQAGARVAIAPADYARFNPACRPVLQLTRGGAASQKLLVVGIAGDKPVAKEAYIGVVQQVGRKEMRGLVDELVAGRVSFKGIKTVSRLEDLYPLLALENADYILVEPQQHEALKRAFATSTRVVAETKETGHPVVCGLDGGAAVLERLQPATLKALGFDGIGKALK